METARCTWIRCGNGDANTLTGSHGHGHTCKHIGGGTPHPVPHQKTLGYGQQGRGHCQVALWVNHAVTTERDRTSQRKMLIPDFKKKINVPVGVNPNDRGDLTPSSQHLTPCFSADQSEDSEGARLSHASRI